MPKALLEQPDTVVPSNEDAKVAAQSSRVLASKPGEGDLHVRLDDGRELTLPGGAVRLLGHVLKEMAQGNAVTVLPINAELTTQEAADFLNVSRPYLIRLLEDGKIRHRKVGTHRRVSVRALQAFKRSLEEVGDRALDELAAQAQHLKMGY